MYPQGRCHSCNSKATVLSLLLLTHLLKATLSPLLCLPLWWQLRSMQAQLHLHHTRHGYLAQDSWQHTGHHACFFWPQQWSVTRKQIQSKLIPINLLVSITHALFNAKLITLADKVKNWLHSTKKGYIYKHGHSNIRKHYCTILFPPRMKIVTARELRHSSITNILSLVVPKLSSFTRPALPSLSAVSSENLGTILPPVAIAIS